MLRILKRKYSIKLSHLDEPRSTIKIISRAKNVKKTTILKKHDDKEENVRNPVGIQMISENLFRQIFGTSRKTSFDAELVEK